MEGGWEKGGKECYVRVLTAPALYPYGHRGYEVDKRPWHLCAAKCTGGNFEAIEILPLELIWHGVCFEQRRLVSCVFLSLPLPEIVAKARSSAEKKQGKSALRSKGRLLCHREIHENTRGAECDEIIPWKKQVILLQGCKHVPCLHNWLCSESCWSSTGLLCFSRDELAVWSGCAMKRRNVYTGLGLGSGCIGPIPSLICLRIFKGPLKPLKKVWTQDPQKNECYSPRWPAMLRTKLYSFQALSSVQLEAWSTWTDF